MLQNRPKFTPLSDNLREHERAPCTFCPNPAEFKREVERHDGAGKFDEVSFVCIAHSNPKPPAPLFVKRPQRRNPRAR